MAGGRERDGLRRDRGRERVGGRGRDKYTERGREREREGEENCFFFFRPMRERESVCGGREGGRERERGTKKGPGGRERGWEGGGETNTQREGGTEGEREREKKIVFSSSSRKRES